MYYFLTHTVDVHTKMAKKRRQGDPCENDSDSTSDEQFKAEKSESGPKCAHVKRAVDKQKLRKLFNKSSVEKEKCVECTRMTNGDTDAGDFEYDLSLWMCLKCGSHLCGRTVNKHALNHFTVSYYLHHLSLTGLEKNIEL